MSKDDTHLTRREFVAGAGGVALLGVTATSVACKTDGKRAAATEAAAKTDTQTVSGKSKQAHGRPKVVLVRDDEVLRAGRYRGSHRPSQLSANADRHSSLVATFMRPQRR